METHAFRDPVFKGCTRPATWLGVPLVPLLGVTGLISLIASATTVLVYLLIPPVVLVMGLVTRSDDQQYRLLGLMCWCRLRHPDRNARFWQASTYAPLRYRQHPRA